MSILKAKSYIHSSMIDHVNIKVNQSTERMTPVFSLTGEFSPLNKT